MTLSEERLREFNARLNQWIAKQGLLFHIFHGGMGIGSTYSFFKQLFRLFLALLIIALFASACYAGFLYFQVSGKKFGQSLIPHLEKNLAVPKINSNGYRRSSSVGQFRQLVGNGTRETFFDSFEARNISFRLSPFEILRGQWNAEKISIGHLLLHLKAGAVGDAEAHLAWNQLFGEFDEFSYSDLESKITDIAWGYSSSSTWGSIRNSRLYASRESDRWSLNFNGGQFSHGCLRDLNIVNLRATLDKLGSLVIEEAHMKKGNASIAWSSQITSGQSRPIFEGSGTLEHFSIETFFPPKVAQFLGGTVSGTFNIEGSTNASEGLQFQFQLNLDDPEDSLFLTHEIPLLRMLSALDRENSYRKVYYNQGQLNLTVSADDIEVSDLDLNYTEIGTNLPSHQLKGEFTARPATTQELLKNFPSLNLLDSLQTELSLDELQQLPEGDFNTLFNLFKAQQYTTPPLGLELALLDQDGTPHKKPFMDDVLRRKLRIPYQIEGQLHLGIAKNALSSHQNLPELMNDDDDALQFIKIDLNNFETEITHELTKRWEQSLNQ